MTLAMIDILLRPIKLAFVINPNDKKTLLDIMQINSIIWGGAKNPIIPFYKKLPNNWDDYLKIEKSKPFDILKGYIDAFDPDYIVVPNDQAYKAIYSIKDKNICHIDDLVENMQKTRVPNYGIGIFEIMREYHKKELKYLRKNKLKIVIPNFPRHSALFLGSIFGSISEDLDTIIKHDFDYHLEIDRPSCNQNNYFDLIKNNIISPLQLCSDFMLETMRYDSYKTNGLFFMDATKSLDIIDYWNLRASGWNVLPIAKQIKSLMQTKIFCENFIEYNYEYFRNLPNVLSTTTILKSRSVDLSEIEDFVKSLNICKPARNNHSKLAVQGWYPKIWEITSREHSCVSKIQYYSKKKSIRMAESSVTIESLDPEVELSRSYLSGEKFVNEFNIRVYQDTQETFAEVIPNMNFNVSKLFTGTFRKHWRATSNGLAYLLDNKYTNINFTLPKAENVFITWLESYGWKANLSPAGLIAKQILRYLKGLDGAEIISNEELVLLLEEMSSGRTYIHHIKKISDSLQKYIYA